MHCNVQMSQLLTDNVNETKIRIRIRDKIFSQYRPSVKYSEKHWKFLSYLLFSECVNNGCFGFFADVQLKND